MRYLRLTCLIIIALCAISVDAQSGRRQAKPTPAAPIPTPTPEPTPIPKKDDKEPNLLFFVGVDRGSAFASFPIVYYDAALRGCADRLRTGSSAGVDVSERDLTRGEAIKKAESEEKTYVILLELTVNSMSRSYDDLELEFVVFAPTTAKVVTSGRSYLRGNRAGPLVVGRTPRGTSSIYLEQLVRKAGEDAADRILKALHLNLPRR
jgi:hypothetical protein